MGFFSFFGDPTVAIPSLLNIFHIPSDTFRFFLVADNLVGTRFGTLLAAMYTLVLAVLSASAVSGMVKLQWKKMIAFIGISLVLLLISVAALRFYYQYVVKHEYKDYETLVSMKMIHPYPQETVYNTALPQPNTHHPDKSRIEEIINRGYIRAGYFADALPFAFPDKSGKLIGYDIEMAHLLAQDMNVKLELVQIPRNQTVQMLDSGIADVVMSGVAVTLDKTAEMGLTIPYLNQTFAFIVKDYRLEDFNSRRKVKSIKKLKIGTPNSPYYIEKIKQYLPQAETVIIGSPKEFFEHKEDDLDAYAYSAEAGSAWSLVHPEYTVAIPYPDVLEVPLAYGIAKGDNELKNYLDTWIDLKRKDKTIDALYNHWILGKDTKNKEPRWSVIRNVLHWVP